VRNIGHHAGDIGNPEASTVTNLSYFTGGASQEFLAIVKH
jgi:hypothetical protein